MQFQKCVILAAFAVQVLHAGDLGGVSETASNTINGVPAVNQVGSKTQGTSKRWKAAWLGSLAFEGAATAYDAYTSYHQGPYESNGLLRGPDGQFGSKAVAIKAVTFGGFAAAQWLVVRKWPKMSKVFIPVNAFLGTGYVHAGVHNEQFLAAQH